MLCSAVRVSSVYSGHLIFFGGGFPQNLQFSLPQTAAKLCAVGFFIGRAAWTVNYKYITETFF